LLDTYGEERKRHVRTVVGHAKAFGLIIGELDVARARVRDQHLEEELQSGRAVTVRQKFIPGLETGLLHRNADGSLAAGAGELCIQPWVRSAATEDWQRLDDVAGANYTLITTSASHLSQWSDQDRARWQALGGTCVLLSDDKPHDAVPGVRQLTERDGLMRNWLEALGAQAVIARPDHYVYGVASSIEATLQLIEELEQTSC
jgi:3-(3-hydroxy-phenyl)propionate hydroxylase